MPRISLLFAVVLAAAYALTTTVDAAVVVGQGTVETSTGGATTLPFVSILNGNSSLGHTFNNNLNAANNDPTAGGTVVTVGSNLLSAYGFAGGGGSPIRYNTLDVVLVFGIEGTASPGALVDFNANAGRMGLFVLPAGVAYNQYNPLTWGAVDATGTTLLAPIAVWDIKPREAVIDPGPDTPGGAGPGIFNLNASQVNQISVNTAAPQATQGFFLFQESSTFGGLTLSGNDYWTTTSLPAGWDLGAGIDEGMVIRTDESANFNPATNLGFISGGLGTPGFDALNTIATQLGGLSLFASDYTAFNAGVPGADPTTFAPGPAGQASDILTTFGVTAGAGVQFGIPEPGSCLIWFVAGGLCLGAARWRRRRAVVA